MNEQLKKGRSAKPKNFIKDPLLSPYYINIEGEKAYTVSKDGDNSLYGYYTTLANALNKVALLKVNVVEEDVIRSIQEYVDEYYEHLENFKKTITI